MHHYIGHLPDRIFTERLRTFVDSYDKPRIHFDGQIDVVQLNQALAGFGYVKSGISPYVPVLVSRQDVMYELERYFQNNPEVLARRHHAGVDAEALCYAFVMVVGP